MYFWCTCGEKGDLHVLLFPYLEAPRDQRFLKTNLFIEIRRLYFLKCPSLISNAIITVICNVSGNLCCVHFICYEQQIRKVKITCSKSYNKERIKTQIIQAGKYWFEWKIHMQPYIQAILTNKTQILKSWLLGRGPNLYKSLQRSQWFLPSGNETKFCFLELLL